MKFSNVIKNNGTFSCIMTLKDVSEYLYEKIVFSDNVEPEHCGDLVVLSDKDNYLYENNELEISGDYAVIEGTLKFQYAPFNENSTITVMFITDIKTLGKI